MPSDVPDHYAILGLDRRCTTAQVRTAFRALAKQHHPDRHGGSAEAEARAQALNAAHEVLSVPNRRRAYDRELDGDQAAPPPTISRQQRNITQDVSLRIEEFLKGASLEICVDDPANPNGAETYQLEVPAETAPGATLRVPREAPFDGGFVVVRLRALPGFRFKVRGSDLRCDLRISAQRATRGGSEFLPGPLGSSLRLTVPAGIARGEVLRLPGEGLPKPRGGRGDLLVKVTYRPEVRVTRR